MFLSKIWFFLVAIAAAAALTLALIMPRPAERAALQEQRSHIGRACNVADILLTQNARQRIAMAGEIALAGVAPIAAKASSAEIVSGELAAKARETLTAITAKAKGSIKPDFIMLLDTKGRLVGHVGAKDLKHGDSMRGYFAVEDALNGFVRDDIWDMKGTLVRIAASPVLTRDLRWAGAVVVGHNIDNDLAKNIGAQVHASIGLYGPGGLAATNDATQVHQDVIAAVAKMEPGMCKDTKSFYVSAGPKSYTAHVATLPGEAGDRGAFYVVFAEKPAAIGFSGTIDAVKKEDLSMGNFPWIAVAFVFLGIATIGLLLMVWETDRPLRKLSLEVIELAKGETRNRLSEDLRGKYGAVARSVNITLDKLERDASSAKKDLDRLMGPAATGPKKVSTIGTVPAPKKAAPPPGDFQFSNTPIPGTLRVPKELQVPKEARGASAEFEVAVPKSQPGAKGQLDLSSGTPVSPGATAPPPRPGTPPPVLPNSIDADILDNAPTTEVQVAGDGRTYQSIFEEFIASKKECGENTDNLTFDKFKGKLVRNRDALMAKHNCNSVKFQVYVKDGKAALKASPIK